MVQRIYILLSRKLWRAPVAPATSVRIGGMPCWGPVEGRHRCAILRRLRVGSRVVCVRVVVVLRLVGKRGLHGGESTAIVASACHAAVYCVPAGCKFVGLVLVARASPAWTVVTETSR